MAEAGAVHVPVAPLCCRASAFLSLRGVACATPRGGEVGAARDAAHPEWTSRHGYLADLGHRGWCGAVTVAPMSEGRRSQVAVIGGVLGFFVVTRVLESWWPGLIVGVLLSALLWVWTAPRKPAKTDSRPARME